MKTFLIRHGEQQYPYNEQGKKMVCTPDAPLVELGRRQLRELAKEFVEARINLDALYTSPLPRARRSAEELAQELLPPPPIYVVDDLREVSPNSGEGETYEKVEAQGGDIYAHPIDGKAQESLGHAVERTRDAAEFILAEASRFGFATVGIVGHGDPLCFMRWCGYHEGLPLSYSEAKEGFYPQKGEAYGFVISDQAPFKIIGKGKVISTEAAKQTREDFRYANPETR